MNYKKLLKNQKFRFGILRLFSWVPPKYMIYFQYWIKLNRVPNLRNPKRFTEKIQYYKLSYRNPKMKVCVDKYLVREYVESCGCSKYLNELYYVYDNVASNKKEVKWIESNEHVILKGDTKDEVFDEVLLFLEQ